MSNLSTDNWQTIFSFLDVESADATCNVFKAAHEAFFSCVFIVMEMPRHKLHHVTSKEAADKKFKELKNKMLEKTITSRWHKIIMWDAKYKIVEQFKTE